LLGLPQGLAIYQDGVRINEPFGDTVNWALIPESSIASVTLVPGSNPLFGLNALGGAIAVRTKNGLDHSGARAEVTAGSWGRLGVEAELGGLLTDDLGYYVTAAHLEEEGWRDYSPTEAQQIFGKLTWQGDDSRLDVALTRVGTDLTGNGAAPEDLLELDREAIFTHPDQTENTLTMLGVSGERSLSADVTLRGNLYVRESDIDTLNGDDSDFEECESTPGFICEEEDGGEEIVLDENEMPIVADEALEGGTINRTETEQSGMGFALQADLTGELAGRENLFTVGASHDVADVEFGASTELGALDATRRAIGGGAFIGEAFIGLETSTSNTGFYLSNTFSFGERAALTISGRYNRTQVVLRRRPLVPAV
jgi:outer membrane receptor protein involved in Fe transport